MLENYVGSMRVRPDRVDIQTEYSPNAEIVIHSGSCIDLLTRIADESVQLIITSPPYNIGKAYERKLRLDEYVHQQSKVILECVRVLKPTGSICWQVGNFVEGGAIVPLDSVLYPVFKDAGLQLRNRIVWHFEHGLHCSRRLSGRYETVNWFTKCGNYVFNLDPIRVPQKYPGKRHFKGPRIGQLSGNPLGKNPGDVWLIPNVKNNHVEKTDHPCQFPVELVERLVLSLSNSRDIVLDPFLGSGTTSIAAVRHDRRAFGAEIIPRYVAIARRRIMAEIEGTLRTRPMTRPIYSPEIRTADSALLKTSGLKQSQQESLRLDASFKEP